MKTQMLRFTHFLICLLSLRGHFPVAAANAAEKIFTAKVSKPTIAMPIIRAGSSSDNDNVSVEDIFGQSPSSYDGVLASFLRSVSNVRAECEGYWEEYENVLESGREWKKWKKVKTKMKKIKNRNGYTSRKKSNNIFIVTEGAVSTEMKNWREKNASGSDESGCLNIPLFMKNMSSHLDRLEIVSVEKKNFGYRARGNSPSFKRRSIAEM
uniref:Uncharacterized protein n=1 Tax=Corethron hystrix TaxID=216773 RepID=A0A7S1BTF9_9STRA|mmetsp:Transcript_40450/g.95034  ORF Transcript_40450/g.95034 Transcript_40450/m.95034 type:complete len:210 (+) Transcript_40450:83-712(+)